LDKAVAGGLPNDAEDVSVERLKELLDYVGQVIKLDERPAFKLSEYRLGTRRLTVACA
jgi:hypothetical protein